MLARIALWALQRYLGGPAKSWLFASIAVLGFRTVRRAIRGRELVETIPVGPGDRYLVEHLTTTHRKQLRAERRGR
jgi:hypothetical protein